MSDHPTGTRGETPRRKPLLFMFGSGVGGGAWSALMQIAATPWYLRLLGVESYGLIGFYAALQALLQVLDMGVSLMVSREVARLTAEGKPGELRNLVRTLELLYWLAAVIIGGALVLASKALARGWFQDSRLPAAELQQALLAMAFLWAAQWLVSFYQAQLIGLERFGALNLLKGSSATMMHAGGVLWLMTVSATPAALFAFQTAAAGVHLFAYLLVVRSGLPSVGARMQFGLLASRGRFAGALAGITVCGALLAQSDKVILSRMLPLRDFGVYALASLVASSLFIVVVPLFQAILPRLSAFSATGNASALLELYRGATEATAVLAISPAAVIALLGGDVIALWTGNADIARRAAPLAAVLLIGSALNALMTPSYALQLATGRTRFPLIMVASQLACFIPLVILLGTRYGALGAAAAWPLIHIAYVLIGIPYTHRYLLGDNPAHWLRLTLPPALAAVAVALVASRFAPMGLLSIAATSAAVLLAAVLAAPRVREAALTMAHRVVR